MLPIIINKRTTMSDHKETQDKLLTMVSVSHTKAHTGCQTVWVLNVPVTDSWALSSLLDPASYPGPHQPLPSSSLLFLFPPLPPPLPFLSYSFSLLYNLVVSAMHSLGFSLSLLVFSPFLFFLSCFPTISLSSLGLVSIQLTMFNPLLSLSASGCCCPHI